MAIPINLKPDDRSLSLALAMVCASSTPLLLLDGEFAVIAVSASFCDAFTIDPSAAVGRSFFDLGAGEWDVPQLRSLMDATRSGDAEIEAYETELLRRGDAPRFIALNVRKLAYGDPGNLRFLVAVADRTETLALARVANQMARDNDLLMQELRHRVANSLQIIASVMMLSARRTSSEETRGHLRDAHNRVMSVANLQMQLAVASSEAVNVRTYLTRLCMTIGASMIADPETLKLAVTAPDLTVEPEVSVSLGLIVTELVINSLKHAFPDGAGGSIEVSYTGEAPNWTLSVTDNGVGMPKVRSRALAGLGTSIVQALARQLGARVEVADANPGTKVSIVHAAVRPRRVQTDPSAPQFAV
jgi:two-component sensor histidine kinase